MSVGNIPKGIEIEEQAYNPNNDNKFGIQEKTINGKQTFLTDRWIESDTTMEIEE